MDTEKSRKAGGGYGITPLGVVYLSSFSILVVGLAAIGLIKRLMGFPE